MSAPGDLFAEPAGGSFPAPRAFQDVAHRELRAGAMSGHQRQLVMAPTGAGKTYLALRLCNEALARGRRVMFVCDRTTLIKQTQEAARQYGMQTPGIIQASNPGFALWRPFQIASAQTLAVRGAVDDFDVIVIDEAHTLYKATTELVKTTKATVVALSATPFTKGLGAIYSRVINAATMHELVALGVLTPFRIRECVRPDMTGAKTTGGEWTAKSAGERGASLIGDVVHEWLTHASDRKTIIFGPTVAHAEGLVEKFRAAGVEAATFTGTTPDGERATLLEEYRKPDSRLRILVSVEALAKGFDVPDVSCVVDCRPLRKSLSTYIQMIGRGLRSSPGKTECLVIDHSGNARRFAQDVSDVYFSGVSELDAGEKLDKEARKEVEDGEVRACPACGYQPMARRCVGCGFEARRESPLEHAHGESQELDILGTSATAYAPTARDLYAMVRHHCEAKAQRRKDAGRPRGNPSGEAWHRYRELTGKQPATQWKGDGLMRATEALTRKLRSLEIAFARGRGRR